MDADFTMMTVVRDTDLQRPSTWWLVVAGFFVVFAIAAVLAAMANQRDATRLIGEGEVFAADVGTFIDILTDGEDAHTAVRHARNELEVEAVSLVDPDGITQISTSPTLIGASIENPMLMYGAAEGRFTAIAGATHEEIQLDGVTEWPAGSVLYEVLSPLPNRPDSLLIHYDLTEMLARRSGTSGLQPETLQLFGLGLLFVVLTGVVLVGHGRVNRRHRELKLESDLLMSHSRELESKNAELEAARTGAERALALAEEKMRIRSEFILMINHELRTPLTTVVTGAELLDGGKLDAVDGQVVLESMVRDGRRLLEMIDQILAVARIENLGLNFQLEQTPLTDVIASVDSQNASVTACTGFGEAEIYVKTDLKTVSMLVASLADNARTHGAETVKIACSLLPIEPMVEVGDPATNAVYIQVIDDGPGIDPEFLPRVFEKFEKSSFSSGTGLGLYIARMMVEAIEASLGVTTSPEGTAFQVALPVVESPSMMVSA